MKYDFIYGTLQHKKRIKMTKNQIANFFPIIPKMLSIAPQLVLVTDAGCGVWCGDRAESICWSPALTRGQRQQGGRDTVHCSHPWVDILTHQVDKKPCNIE